MAHRFKLFSITAKDLEWQTFRAGGSGGQNQNKRDTGVRCRHHVSGAVGESREHRTQLYNKRAAFRRMAESKEFTVWARQIALGMRNINDIIDEAMSDENLVVEFWDPHKRKFVRESDV